MIVLARFVALSLVCCTSTQQVQRTKQLNTLTVNKRSKDKLESEAVVENDQNNCPVDTPRYLGHCDQEGVKCVYEKSECCGQEYSLITANCANKRWSIIINN